MPQSARETAVPAEAERRGRLERFLGSIATVHTGEGRTVSLLCAHAFLLLVCYYLLKTLREPLLLGDSTAEIKSYAHGATALALLLVVPLYGLVFRHTDRRRLTAWVTGFFAMNLACFWAAGSAGFDVAFVYYLWVGVFGVMAIAQFWAHAADVLDAESGPRLFPLIMAAATLGGLAGPVLSGILFGLLGPWPLLLVAIALLTATVPLASSSIAVPRGAGDSARRRPADCPPLGGFALICRDRYLLLLAALVVLLNCVNTTGEYILTELVVRHADDTVARLVGADKQSLIAAFYARLYFSVNALTVVTQLLLVARVFRRIGVQGAVLVLPVIALVGYGLVAFLPVLGLVHLLKIVENSADYSVMNTARHALYLPLPAAEKYQGKIATDTFFWRFGDLLQAGIVYAGIHWLSLELQHFAALNAGLAVVWLAVTVRVARRYASLAGHAPAPRRPIRASARRPSVPRKLVPAYRHRLVALLAAAAVTTLAIPGSSEAQPAELFDGHALLRLDVHLDVKALCRDPRRSRCEDLPATLVDRTAGEHAPSVGIALRVRGRYRADTGGCSLPALFVRFEDGTEGTVFHGQTMLPLTTHCRNGLAYEQYVLKEYLAYRIYNLLTPKSLRVRLARIAYHDSRGGRASFVRYGFFVEHFASLAARHGGDVWEETPVDLRHADPLDIGRLDLFQYLIGNTDWSAVHGHNIVHIRAADDTVTAVPYDFDFSGLVDAAYATVSEKLPIRRVTQRLFRGLCRPDTDWKTLFAELERQRPEIDALVRSLPGLAPEHRDAALNYLDGYFAETRSAAGRDAIIRACRKPHQLASQVAAR